jgi:hypothetical protein
MNLQKIFKILNTQSVITQERNVSMHPKTFDKLCAAADEYENCGIPVVLIRDDVDYVRELPLFPPDSRLMLVPAIRLDKSLPINQIILGDLSFWLTVGGSIVADAEIEPVTDIIQIAGHGGFPVMPDSLERARNIFFGPDCWFISLPTVNMPLSRERYNGLIASYRGIDYIIQECNSYSKGMYLRMERQPPRDPLFDPVRAAFSDQLSHEQSPEKYRKLMDVHARFWRNLFERVTIHDDIVPD